MTVDDHDPRSRLFPPLITIASVLLGVGVQRLQPLALVAGAVGRWVGGVLIAAALALGIWAILAFRRAGTTPDPHGEVTAFVTAGPFRFSRNPMYLTNVVLQIGVAFVLGNAWILLLALVTWLVLDRVVIAGEERYLAGRYGDAYDDYRRRVRRWV